MLDLRKHKGSSLAVAAFALTLALPSGLASAAPKKRGPVFIRTASASLGAMSLASADAFCPKGAALVGGGFEAGPLGSSGPFPFESFRVKGRGWRATAGAGPESAGGTVTSFAMCQRGARKLSPVVAEIQVPVLQGDPGTGPVTVDVGCPGKLRAVSGGFRGSADVTEGVSLPQDSFKKGKRTWRSTGFAIGDPSGATHRQFTSIGYCSRRGRDVEAQSAAVLPAPELSSAFTSPCARRPLTGGFAVSPFDPSGGGVVLLASKPVGTGWEVRGTNLFGPGPAALSAFAYCR